MSNDPNTRLLPDWNDGKGETTLIPPAPATLSHRGREAWLAAYRLRQIIVQWQDWWRQLRTTGDADPGLAGRYCVAAHQAIHILCNLRVGAFADTPAQAIKDILPPIPDGFPGGLDFQKNERGEYVEAERPPWQQDDALLNWHGDFRNHMRLSTLEGKLLRLLSDLKNYPETTLERATAAPEDRPTDKAPVADDGEYITAKQAAAMTALSMSHLSKLCKTGGPVRFQRPARNRLLIHSADLARYMEQNGKA
jgi:hypothetical protein